jgi:hypothetical protein
MSDSTDYAKIIQQAEKAVSSVTDENLRRIAFEKLLTHLLADNELKMQTNEGPAPSIAGKKKSKSRSVGGQKQAGKKAGPKSWLRELVDEGFFKKPKSSSDIREELENRSHHLRPTDLTGPLESLCHEKLLRRKKMTLEDNGKPKMHWMNW